MQECIIFILFWNTYAKTNIGKTHLVTLCRPGTKIKAATIYYFALVTGRLEMHPVGS